VGIINVIKLGNIEECLKDIVGLSFQIRLFQEEYQDVAKQIKDNKARFSSGNIPKDVFGKNQNLLEGEKKRLTGRINESIEKMGKVNSELLKLIRQNRI
jgi:hypothetical protein